MGLIKLALFWTGKMLLGCTEIGICGLMSKGMGFTAIEENVFCIFMSLENTKNEIQKQ